MSRLSPKRIEQPAKAKGKPWFTSYNLFATFLSKDNTILHDINNDKEHVII